MQTALMEKSPEPHLKRSDRKSRKMADVFFILLQKFYDYRGGTLY